ncbi:MAG TPA: SWIM zinc finger family protein [Nakamurella sp.]
MSWAQYPQSRPRAVEGGLKARSARGDIGSSWWSKRFLTVLESFALGTRLTRGRSYARKGQVISLEVTPGLVRATVQGSRVRPYEVTIGFAPLRELVWAKAEIALSEQALPSAKLLAGEVPPELEEIFADAGAPLFPRTVRDLAQRCSCPDREVPCKHLAATFYLLAEAFDADPFLILRWRGRDREPLLARLRELRSEPGAAGSVARTDSVPATAGAALALAGLPGTAAEIDRFWSSPPLPARPAVLPVDADLLLRQLPPPGPALGGDTLVKRLGPAYGRFAGGEQ